MANGDTPHRRQDDSVSYRDMVEYVSEADARYHAARAESLIQVSNSLEKLERKLDDHEKWHQTVLESLLSSRRTNGIAMASVGVAGLATLSTIISLFVIHHG